MIKLPPLALQQAETAAGAVVLRRRRRRRRSGDGLLTDAPADDEKPEWARVLEATLDAERQRGEVRAWICKDGVDEHSDACHVRRLLGELSADDLSRPFGDERTFGDLALERGRLHFLSAYLDAGGVILKEGGPPLGVGPSVDAFPRASFSPRRHRRESPQVGPKGRLASPRSVARCRKLAGDWRRYEAAARRSLRPGSHATDLATYLATGIVGVREASSRGAGACSPLHRLGPGQARARHFQLAGRPSRVALKSAEAGRRRRPRARALAPRRRIQVAAARPAIVASCRCFAGSGQCINHVAASRRHRRDASSRAWHTGSGANNRR